MTTQTLVIRPAPVQVDTLNAMLKLGFDVAKAEVEHRPAWQGEQGFVQIFVFRAGGQPMSSNIEMAFRPDGTGGFTLLLQLRRTAATLAGLLAEVHDADAGVLRIPLSGGLRGPGEPDIADSISRTLNS